MVELLNYLKQIFFLLSFMLLIVKNQIIENPIIIYNNELKYPIIFKANDSSYNIISYGKIYSLDGITSQFNFDLASNDFLYSPPYFLCIDESNNYFLFANNEYFKIYLDSNLNIQYMNKTLSINFDGNTEFFGYIKQNQFNQNHNYNYYYNFISIEKNEIILYGKKGSKINFYYISTGEDYVVINDNDNIGEYISCKFVEDASYICAYYISSNHKVEIDILSLTENNGNKELKLHDNNKILNDFKDTDNITLFDTNDNRKKILCARETSNNRIKCSKIEVHLENPLVVQNIDFSSINIEMSFDEKKCGFISFYSEYLLCCLINNTITCIRFNNQFNLINKFSINLHGENTFITIFNNTNYSSIFYQNINNNSSLNEYIIYRPTCFDIYKEISVYQNCEININELFLLKYNNTYILNFKELPFAYGNISFNGKLLSDIPGQIYIKNINDSLYFESTNNKSNNSIIIPYSVSIKETTYSAECKIHLNIFKCYYSCHKCSKSYIQSNSSNHNCLIGQCEQNYYQSPINPYNCFNLSEKPSSWYFDNDTLAFGLCDEECESCYGPNNINCLSCYNSNINSNFSHLYKNQCLNKCPISTYEIEFNGYYRCEECYKNCKTCNQSGNYNNMNCNSCLNDSDIKKDNNCYKTYDSISKSFYNPENITNITSCFQLFNYYIKENTYECIPELEEGYYISNNLTGLISKCHFNCKTCSKNYTEFNNNCDLCINDTFYLQEGNCVSNCSIGYYLEGNICKKCHNNCLECTSGKILDGSKMLDMNCLECKNNYNMIKIGSNCFQLIEYSEEKIFFDISEIIEGKIYGSCLDFNMSIRFGEYECKPKPNNSFYVLNDINNTGIIEDCDIACNLCNAKNNSLDTNCINCAPGYFKTEESNTNCILENLIPINYYKNISDNIYYKCHHNCYNCTEKYNQELDDMHCLSCPKNYYFLNGTNNCYNINFTIENEGYYFSDIEYLFYKCYNTCAKCLSKEYNEDNNYCTKCISDLYFLENTTNCYNLSLLNEGYYLYNNTSFKKCFANCKTCTDYYINNDMNCIYCQDGLYKLNGTNNCYNLSLTNSGYYFKQGILYPCHESCLTCSDSPNYNSDLLSNISNNCLSCDKDNKNLFLVEDLNNCENINYTINGYYLTKNDDGIEVLKKCYKSCKLCNAGLIYDNITEQFNHNCIECADYYYRIKDDINNLNCYGNEMLLLNYTLENNVWKICHDNCLSCYGQALYDENNELISQNCIKCINNYNFIFNTKDCYNNSIIESSYFLNNNDSMYHKCDIQCKICEQEKTKCLVCNTEQGYYIAENKSNFHCYNNTNIGNGYILLNNLDSETKKISDKKWVKCYPSCSSCFDYGNYTNHNCIFCSINNYFIYNTTNCITENYAKENGFYFNITYNKFTKCDIACSTCNKGYESDNTNCIKCNSEKGYFPLYNNNSQCYNSEQIPEGYYLDYTETTYKWKNCYEKCAKCSNDGNDFDMNCLSCKKNYTKTITNKTVYLRLSKGNCIEECPNNLFITSKGDCVETCPNGTFQFIPNISCVESCPFNYEINSEKTQCVLKKSYEILTTEEFKKQILNNISSYVNSSNIINGSNFLAIILSSGDMNPEEQIKQGISAIDLGNCVSELKTHYHISNDQNLIILEIEEKESEEKNIEDDSFNLGKSIIIEVYDTLGQKLDLSVCKSEIKIMKYIGDAEGINIQTAMDLTEQGIDVFNAQDKFFNDICHPFNNKNGTDIVLSDRREDIYQNVSFCQDGCIYSGTDYQLMIANCLCDASIIQGKTSEENEEGNKDEKLTISNLANTFTENLLDFNFIVIKCYNLVFNYDILMHNIGFFTMFTLKCLQIAAFIAFLIKRLKAIRYFMYIFKPFDPRVDPLYPPPKTKHKLKTIYDVIKKENNKKKIKYKVDNDIIIGNINNYKDKEKNKKIIKFKGNENKNYSRNITFENEDKKGKTKSITKRNYKLNTNTINVNNKNNFYETYLKEKGYNVYNYEINQTKHIRNKNIFKNIFSPINDNQNNKKEYNETNNIISNSERENIKNSETGLKNHESLFNSKITKIKPSQKRIKYKSEKYKINEKINKNKYNTIKETGINLNKEDSIKNNKIDEIEYKDKIINFAYTDEDFQDMDYEEAYQLDKRSCLRIYWSFLVETQIILATFFTSNFLYLFVVKLSFLFFTFQISFFLNALFYTDEYISDAYHNNGVLDFFSGLPKSIYSFLATMITTSLLGMLNNSKKELIDIIRERKNKKEYLEKVNSKLKKLRNKLIVYYIFLFLFGLFFLYYVSAFCAVYRHSQKYWLFGCFESFGIDSLVSISICIFLAFFRLIAVRKRIKYLYIITKIINSFL